ARWESETIRPFSWPYNSRARARAAAHTHRISVVGMGVPLLKSSEQGGLVHSGRDPFGVGGHRQVLPVGEPLVSVVGVQVAQVIGVLAIRGLVPQPGGRFLVAVEVGARHGRPPSQYSPGAVA